MKLPKPKDMKEIDVLIEKLEDELEELKHRIKELEIKFTKSHQNI